MSGWGGRKVRRLVALVLHLKGRVCHLCRLDGADSADHEPPRSVLVATGVADPDALRYLMPAHLKCNVRRGDRPVTDALRVELRAKRLYDLGVRAADAFALSPRFADRPVFPHIPTPGKDSVLPPIARVPTRIRRSDQE